ncbi:hypothetical protein [Puia sp.]|uniref:hypothetical protein n=1 Tax=Puia sp. TaxID=2045100 RepID=UPI002F41A6E7
MRSNLSRRNFLGLALGGIGLGLMPPGAALSPPGTPPPAQEELAALCRELTATWARTLLSLQVVDASRTNDYGGIFCPTRKMVHGRVGDTIYPFMHMARRTGDHRYIDASVLLFRWMEGHVSQPDGSWLNEIKDSWKGTTVFTVIALCEALHYHGDLMEPQFRQTVEARLRKAGDFIYTTVDIDYGNINYPLSASYALSLLGTLQDVPRYRERGRVLSQQAIRFFSKQDGFIFGEGTPYYQPSPKGCFSVDLGYNVEETLPSLALYGLLNKDEELLHHVTRSLQTHMEFMLPDGGWDNSWGTRNYKWTYWGSRTSDGCQPAYALLAGRDARFARVAHKNALLLRECTHDGLLYGGPHYLSHGVLPSVHHSFCHSKALTTVLDHGLPAAASGVPQLPREEAYGRKFFPDIQTWLIAVGGYRATVTAYDREYKAMHNGHATGGALSMLWHDRTGPLLAASMNAYQLVEAGNMQADTDPLSMPLTPRIELVVDGVTYLSCSNLEATVEVTGDKGRIIARTRGRLVDRDQRDPPAGALYCRCEYLFTPEKVTLSFAVDDPRAWIIVPVISRSGEAVELINDRKMLLRKPRATVVVETDQPIVPLPAAGRRLFNFVPGLEAIPLVFDGGKAQIGFSID